MNDIPIFDLNNEEDKTDFELAMNSTSSSTDYQNDRGRPYNGQKHTSLGERGKTEVKGLTMRDIRDCIVQGFLASSGQEELCNITSEINKDMIGSKYQKKDTWRESDLYKLEKLNPIPTIQATMCFIEHMMEIFPNIEPGYKDQILKDLGNK